MWKDWKLNDFIPSSPRNENPSVVFLSGHREDLQSPVLTDEASCFIFSIEMLSL